MEATTRTQLLPNGRTATSGLRRPYIVRTYGSAHGERAFGSLAAARRFATGTYSIFFEYQPGCGHFLEGSAR